MVLLHFSPLEATLDEPYKKASQMRRWLLKEKMETEGDEIVKKVVEKA